MHSRRSFLALLTLPVAAPLLLAKDKERDVFGEFPHRYNEWERLAQQNYNNRAETNLQFTVNYEEIKRWNAVCDEWPRHKKAVDAEYGKR